MMKFEEKPFCPADLVQDVIKMALAATEEKDITVTSEIAADIPKMVSYFVKSAFYSLHKDYT